jgi:D-serine deaminase-like pyridoxal phosphate-dependent protein
MGDLGGIACLAVTPAREIYTELQCDSYIFMDADYGRNLGRGGAPTKAFEPSLFAWATVMSRPTEDRAIVDAGLKALAFDSGPPLVWDEPAATYERASDEHGRLGNLGCHQPPRPRRQDPPRARPLRPDRQLLRLVCRHPRQPRRAALADHREGCGLVIS